MNFSMKIHPAIAVLVLACSIVGIGVKVWADGRVIELGGPAQLLRDPAGNVYLQIQNQLLQHDQAGIFVRRHDLGELGVDVVIGAIGFFPDGDILVRRGADPRTLSDNVAAYQRIGGPLHRLRSPANLTT